MKKCSPFFVGVDDPVLVALSREVGASCGEQSAQEVLSSWKASVKTRKSGKTKGSRDIYFTSPDGTRFRSRREVLRHFGEAVEPKPFQKAEPASTSVEEDDPVEAKEKFMAAAKIQGNAGFEAQRAAFEALMNQLQAIADSGGQSTLLSDVREELRRLHINFSCRARQRSGEVRKYRDELTRMVRRARDLERILDPAGYASAKRRLELDEFERRKAFKAELRSGVPYHLAARDQEDDCRDEEMKCLIKEQTNSSDHLCPHMCYFREHEGPRQLFALRRVAFEALGAASVFDGWRTIVEPNVTSTKKTYAMWRVVFRDPTGVTHQSASEALDSVGLDGKKLAPSWPRASHGGDGVRRTKPQLDELDLVSETHSLRASLWPKNDDENHRQSASSSSPRFSRFFDSDEQETAAGGPPRSPFGLLEEILWADEYKLLVACMMLNVTTRAQVDVVIWRLFHSFPDAQSAAATLDRSDQRHLLETILRPLGLHRKRARRMALMAKDWLAAKSAQSGGEKKKPLETVSGLYGVGDYAADAHELFILRRFSAHKPPRDHALRWYHAWILERLSG